MGSYLLVKCGCGFEQPVFKYAISKIKCASCGAILAEPTGGTAKIVGKIEKELD